MLLTLAFLGRSLILTFLAKDLERYKADLQIAAVEHRVRFSKLHEKRAEVLAEPFKLLVEATWHTSTFVNPFQWPGDPDKNKQYGTAIHAIAQYFHFFDQHRIWLPDHLCLPLEDFAKRLRTPIIAVGVYQEIEFPNNNTLKDGLDACAKAWNSAETEIPQLRAAIEKEFRALLDAGSK